MSRPDPILPAAAGGAADARLTLQPRHLQQLALSPGESIELELTPAWSGPHTLRCFGPTGLLLELRDEEGTALELVPLDETSAPSVAPRRRVTLIQGQRYVVRATPSSDDFEGAFSLLIW